MKVFKELAFFLELEKMDYLVSAYRNASLYVDTNDDITFNIWVENGQYVLETEFYRSGLRDESGRHLDYHLQKQTNPIQLFLSIKVCHYN